MQRTGRGGNTGESCPGNVGSEISHVPASPAMLRKHSGERPPNVVKRQPTCSGSESRMYLDAVYLAGYAVECALKSLILERTPKSERREVLDELTSGARAHNFDVLSRMLRMKGCSPPPDIRESLVSLNEEWRTDLRYVGALITYREAEQFLQRVKVVYEWVQRNL